MKTNIQLFFINVFIFVLITLYPCVTWSADGFFSLIGTNHYEILDKAKIYINDDPYSFDTLPYALPEGKYVLKCYYESDQYIWTAEKKIQIHPEQNNIIHIALFQEDKTKKHSNKTKVDLNNNQKVKKTKKGLIYISIEPDGLAVQPTIWVKSEYDIIPNSYKIKKFSLPPGNYEIYVSADKYISTIKKINVSGKENIYLNFDLYDKTTYHSQQRKTEKLRPQIKAEIERQQRQRREAEQRRQRYIEQQLQREAEQRRQRDIEQQQQRETEQRRQRDIEQQQQREAEQQRQRDIERQQQREAEQQRQRDIERQQQREAEQRRQRDILLQQQREAEQRRQREIELQLQPEAEIEQQQHEKRLQDTNFHQAIEDLKQLFKNLSFQKREELIHYLKKYLDN